MRRAFNSRSGSRGSYGLRRHYRGILTTGPASGTTTTMKQTPLRLLMSRVARVRAAPLQARDREQRLSTAEASRRDAAEERD